MNCFLLNPLFLFGLLDLCELSLWGGGKEKREVSRLSHFLKYTIIYKTTIFNLNWNKNLFFYERL